jgi:hypothetical protein
MERELLDGRILFPARHKNYVGYPTLMRKKCTRKKTHSGAFLCSGGNTHAVNRTQESAVCNNFVVNYRCAVVDKETVLYLPNLKNKSCPPIHSPNSNRFIIKK